MTLEEKCNEYLRTTDLKEKLKENIAKGVEEYKTHQAYEWERGDCPYDCSGELHKIYNKTIGDVYDNDIDILQAYTGNWEATYESGCGMNYLTVADEMTYDLRDIYDVYTDKFVKEHWNDVKEAYPEIEGDFSIENVLELYDTWDFIKLETFNEWFPEYMIEEETIIEGKPIKWLNEIFTFF